MPGGCHGREAIVEYGSGSDAHLRARTSVGMENHIHDERRSCQLQ